MFVESLLMKGAANDWSVLQHFLVNKVESLEKLLNLEILRHFFQIYIAIGNWKQGQIANITII